jgi:uncharacterized membrane protein
MVFLRNKSRRTLTIVTVTLSVLYPGFVYFGHDRFSPLAFVSAVVVLTIVRIYVSGSVDLAKWRVPLFATLLGLMAISAIDLGLAMRFYPVLMSLGIGALFGFTLFYPPSLIERFARIREPDLPLEKIHHCRRVTIVWTVFSLFNASIAGWASLWGSIELWSLWTGLISYIVMGVLFVGEFVVRSRLKPL